MPMSWLTGWPLGIPFIRSTKLMVRFASLMSADVHSDLGFRNSRRLRRMGERSRDARLLASVLAHASSSEALMLTVLLYLLNTSDSLSRRDVAIGQDLLIVMPYRVFTALTTSSNELCPKFLMAINSL